MQAMLNTFTEYKDDYIDKLPSDILKRTAQGFFIAATLSVISGSAGSAVLIAGALAASVTLVEAVTRPIIKSIFDDMSVSLTCSIIFTRLIVMTAASVFVPSIVFKNTIGNSIINYLFFFYINETKNKYYSMNQAMYGFV